MSLAVGEYVFHVGHSGRMRVYDNCSKNREVCHFGLYAQELRQCRRTACDFAGVLEDSLLVNV